MGQPLGFRDVGRGHFAGYGLAVGAGDIMARRRGQVHPHPRLDIVLRDTPARGVGHAQVALGVSVALPGRRAILAHGLAVVLIDTQAMEVGNA